MKRWYEISSNPNAIEVLQKRNNDLVKARSATLIEDRIAYFCNLVKNRKVLDIGVVEHSREAVNSQSWLHRHLSQAANDCLGVDILKEEIDYLKSIGFNVLCTDITRKVLDRKFDVIVCGEVLEHIESPIALLGNCSKMLEPDGRIIVSVPNPWYINVIVKNLFGNLPYLDNVDHVSWFDPCTLCEVAHRQGLILDKFAGVAVTKRDTLFTKILFGLQPILIYLGVKRELFAKTIIYEFLLAS